MLAVPWHVAPPRVVRALTAPRFIATPEMQNRDEVLESLKRQVGEFILRRGTDAWRRASDAVDARPPLRRSLARPVSRAYFKLVEILRTCAVATPRSSLHLCDAPGGFAQAVMTEYGDACEIRVTSLERGVDVPNFSRDLMRSDRIVVLTVPDGGDLRRATVRDAVVAAGKHDLVTADGAVDCASCPESAEHVVAHLKASEVATALRAQAEGGTFVLKVFGVTRDVTLQLIALLAACYDSVALVKPRYSRSVNDERYVVCQGFRAARAPALHLPDAPREPGVLDAVAAVEDADWLRDMLDLSRQLGRDQAIALRSALSSTSTCEPEGKAAGARGRGAPRRRRP